MIYCKNNYSIISLPDGNIYEFGLKSYDKINNNNIPLYSIPVNIGKINTPISSISAIWSHDKISELIFVNDVGSLFYSKTSNRDDKLELLCGGTVFDKITSFGDKFLATTIEGVLCEICVTSYHNKKSFFSKSLDKLDTRLNNIFRKNKKTDIFSLYTNIKNCSLEYRIYSGLRIIQLSCGNNFCVMIENNDTSRIFAWGDNSKGQLGLGYASHEYIKIPIKIDSLDGCKINKIECGKFHTLALSYYGTIYAWGGSNIYCHLATCVNFNELVVTPILVDLPEEMCDIWCGDFFNICCSIQGLYWSWGANIYGQLCLGFTSFYQNPTIIKCFETLHINNISLGQDHGLLITHNFDVYGWGKNNYYQTGVVRDNNHLEKIIF